MILMIELAFESVHLFVYLFGCLFYTLFNSGAMVSKVRLKNLLFRFTLITNDNVFFPSHDE